MSRLTVVGAKKQRWHELPRAPDNTTITPELLRLQRERDLAWDLYYDALNRGVEFHVLTFQLGQAWVAETRYNACYEKLNGQKDDKESKDDQATH